MDAQSGAPLKHRILYVEDDGDTREMMILLLSFEGFSVTSAGSGKDALNHARSNRFDLFIIDNRLPDLSGLELCRGIRQVAATTPILFFSGVTQESERQAALESGAQGYLVKPAAIEEIVTEIRRVLKATSGQTSLRRGTTKRRKRVSDQLEA